MRTIIITIALIACSAAIAQPWIDHTGTVRYSLPAEFRAPDGAVLLRPTFEMLQPFGWSETVTEQATEVTTNRIDAETRLTIATYAALMQTIFGPGAHLSTNITEDVVVATFEQAGTNIPLPVLTGFAVARDKLRITYPGHFSRLPYGLTEIVTTNEITIIQRKP